MKHRQRRAHILLAAMALFLVSVQPFTALAAEAGQKGADSAAARVLRVQTSQRLSGFVGRLEERTSLGRPMEGATRGQYIQILYEAMGRPAVEAKPLYADISTSDDCAAAVTWAKISGVVEDGGGDLFRPEEQITSLEADLWLTRTLSALAGTANQMASSLLAAYTGRKDDQDLALTPADLVAALDELFSDTRLTLAYPAALAAGPPPAAL